MTDSSDTLFSSWKEIAAYLQKSVRTVQRWETLLGLPVYRPGKRGVVLAYRGELDQWIRRTGALAGGDGHPPVSQAERFQRYAEEHRRATMLCNAAHRRLQELRLTTDRTRAICATLGIGAAPCASIDRTFELPRSSEPAPVPGHGYRNVTVDVGGRDVEAGGHTMAAAANPRPARPPRRTEARQEKLLLSYETLYMRVPAA